MKRWLIYPLIGMMLLCLSCFASADEAPETPLALSGYFFSAPLKREGSDAVQAFDSETDEFTAWVQQRTGQSALVQPVVLRYAGGTEADYLAAVRARTAWMTAAAIVLFCGAAACGVGLLIKWKRGAAGSLAFARRFRYNTGKNGKG